MSERETDAAYYAQLRAVAQTLRAAGQEAARLLTPGLRDDTPDWLLERIDGAVRAVEAAAGDVGRFIREDRLGYAPATSDEWLVASDE